MPDKCSALNCRTGYDNETPPAESGISLFKFPKDPVLVAEWKKRISRQNWEPSARSTVCSLHFKEEDIIREKQDSNKWRAKPDGSKKLAKPRLRTGAIPTIFVDLPSYKNVPVPEERESASRVTAESRRRTDQLRQEEDIEQFFVEDDIQTVDDILKKTQEEVLPEGFVPVKKKNCCCFFFILAENSQEIPQLLTTLTIMEDLTFGVCVLGKLIRPSRFQQLLEKEGKFCHFSEVANVLSAVKNMSEEPEKLDWLDMAEDCLSQFLNLAEDISEEFRGRIEFVKEQLSLSQRKPGTRRYSPGRHRQLSGGNYYISLRQVLDNERKIKAVSLLRMSKCSLTDLGRLEDAETPRLIEEKASELQQCIQLKLDTELNAMDASDANAVGYVAGALVRTELRLRKCQQCSDLLKDTNREKLPEIPLSTLDELGEPQPITENILSFVNAVNRGGLLAPSTLASSIGLKCWSVFNCIDTCKELQSEILSSSNQQMLFVAIVEGLLEEDVDFEEIAIPKLECSGGHKFGRSLIRRFFNCIAKNWVKRLSGDGTGGQSMKIAKLQSHW